MRLRKKLYLELLKFKLESSIKLDKKVDFWKTQFDGHNSVGENSEVSYSHIGKMSYIGKNCILNKTKIGNFCSIGNDVKVIYGTHPVNSFFSTHPAFYSSKSQSNMTFVKNNLFNENNTLENNKSAIIGHDVWIASNAIILEGITIGNGSIIAAGAVVTKDVEPYTIVGGVPAKIIKKRFDEYQIEKLLDMNWWDKDLEWFTHSDNIEKVNKIIKEQK
ncbi:CatB-related O-acetyltransferase [Enterococcus gallinarum]|uniref:CatB-related O-acetyltransferase n=1 Tax=Enterococcus TaxID=1350 RepID=UPI003F76E915